jgi:acetyltransferase-like isoleucine patch superfamily enzyme
MHMTFKSCGLDVTVYPKAQVVRPEYISIGNSVIIDDFVFLDGGTGTEIGDFVHIAAYTSIMGGGQFIMEDFCGLSGGVRVYTASEDYRGRWLTNPAVPHPWRNPARSYVVMLRHSLVGANSVVLAGVTLGEGAHVGALSLVNRDLEPWTLYAGVPVEPIGVVDRDRVYTLEMDLRDRLFKDGKYIPQCMRGDILE